MALVPAIFQDSIVRHVVMRTSAEKLAFQNISDWVFSEEEKKILCREISGPQSLLGIKN